MKNPQFISIWHAPRPTDFVSRLHIHDCYELVYYPFGQGETVVDEKTYIFADNYFTIIPPHTPHKDHYLADSKAICLMFSNCPTLTHHFFYDDTRAIYKILKKIINETQSQNYLYQDMIASKLRELCILLSRIENSKFNEKNFEHIINYIKENYHEKFDFNSCAEQLNLSYYYFSHKFKKITGISPQQFLITTRLAEAKKLLLSKDISCTQIALQCGFSTSAQFSSLFKKEYNISPLEYRRTYTHELPRFTQNTPPSSPVLIPGSKGK